MRRRCEKDIAAAVIKWLRAKGWKVCQEVPLWSTLLIDIVALKDGVTWAIECKTSCSSSLLRQAGRVDAHAVLTSIAYPRPKRRRPLPDTQWRKTTVGILQVDGAGIVEELRAPIGRNDPDHWIYKHLREIVDATPEMDMIIAGQPSKGRVSAFSITCDALREYVREHPGCTMKSAVEGIEHHYANDNSARGSLGKWIRLGKVKGLRWNEHGKLEAFGDVSPPQHG